MAADQGTIIYLSLYILFTQGISEKKGLCLYYAHKGQLCKSSSNSGGIRWRAGQEFADMLFFRYRRTRDLIWVFPVRAGQQIRNSINNHKKRFEDNSKYSPLEKMHAEK